MKLFLVLSAVIIVAMLLGGVYPRLVRFPVVQVSSSQTTGVNLLSPITSSGQPETLPTLAPFGALDEVPYLPNLNTFISGVLTGQDDLVGVYVPGRFALPVSPQPQGRADYVTVEESMVTEFSLPQKYGSTGLLAHNYLSGQLFYDLGPGQEVILVYGNGAIATYRIIRIEEYQALSPNSPLSNFVDLNTPDRDRLTSNQLFHRIYGTSGQLIFQTCIEAYGDPSWGRRFVIAEPVSAMQPSLPTLAPPSLN